jgi:hypothetical protein
MASTQKPADGPFPLASPATHGKPRLWNTPCGQMRDALPIVIGFVGPAGWGRLAAANRRWHQLMQVPAARAQAVVGMRDGARVWRTIEACVDLQTSVFLLRSTRRDARELIACASLEIARRGNDRDKHRVLEMLERCHMTDILTILLQKGLVSLNDIAESKVITNAAKRGDSDMLQTLWKAGVRREHMLRNCGTRVDTGALAGACLGGHLETVRALRRTVKEGGFGFCTQDAEMRECAALVLAAASGNSELVRFLVTPWEQGGFGVQAHNVSKTKSKALWEACRRHNVDVIRFLTLPITDGGMGMRLNGRYIRAACFRRCGTHTKAVKTCQLLDMLRLFRRPRADGGLGVSKEQVNYFSGFGRIIIQRHGSDVRDALEFALRPWDAGGFGLSLRCALEILVAACQNDRPEILSVFREVQGIAGPGPNNRIDRIRHEALLVAARKGHLKVLQALRRPAEQGGLGFGQILISSVLWARMMQRAQDRGHQHIEAFLRMPWSEGGMGMADNDDEEEEKEEEGEGEEEEEGDGDGSSGNVEEDEG